MPDVEFLNDDNFAEGVRTPVALAIAGLASLTFAGIVGFLLLLSWFAGCR